MKAHSGDISMKQALDTSSRTCRACGQAASSHATGRISNGYPLLHCSRCETVLVERRPGPEELRQAYDHLFEKGDYAKHRREFELIKSGKTPRSMYRKLLLRRIEKTSSGRRLIEIGGGTGSFGVLARSRGWQYTDYDISEVAVGFARELSLDAHVFSVESIPPLAPQSVDAVVMWEVIEHVWDVHEYLRTIGEALRPGGVFIFSTPNYARRQYQRRLDEGNPSSPPIHLNFFTEESLRRSLSASGYFTKLSIVKRRFYQPSADLRGILECFKIAMFLEQPGTLFGTAYRSPTVAMNL